MTVTRWWPALGAVVLVACQAPRRDARVSRDSTAGPTIDVASAPGQVTLALWQVRPGITLSEWATTRAGEHIEPYSREANKDYLGDWCARSVATLAAGAHTVERIAYFYPPAPPAGGQLPGDLAPPDSLKSHCELGLVAVQTAVPDSAAGVRLNDSVIGGLERAFGAGRRGTKVSFFASAFWRDVAVWRRRDLIMVSAVSGLPYPTDESAARWSVVTFGFLPLSRLSIDPDHETADVLARIGDTLALADVARAARPDSGGWLVLRRILRAATPADAGAADPAAAAGGTAPGTAPAPLPEDSLARALRRWLLTGPPLPPRQRAALLFVADQVLDRAACAYGLCAGPDSAKLAPFKSLGARFTWSHGADGWVYRRNWLYEARALDRDGPLGQAILLQQLAQGFDPSGTCEGGTDGFQRVLDNGERYLARVPHSPVAAPVHFFLGEANRDIVALADGASDAVDSSDYVGRAGMARGEALRHYRAVIDLAPGTPVAQLAWRRGWWLLAGLPMRGTRFVCTGD